MAEDIASTGSGLHPAVMAGSSTWQRFILDNTRLLAPPLVPEIKVHIAEESLPIWRKTEEQLGEMNVPPPYWAFAWAGGQALARYILDHPDIVRSKHVLDLGSGSGMSAIAAMKAGATSAVAADIDAVALEAIALNAGANGVAVELQASDLLEASPPKCDVLLVGDLFYERSLAERVLAFVQAAAGMGADVLVGDPQRNYFPKDRFVMAAQYNVPVTRELEDAEIRRTAVWRLA